MSPKPAAKPAVKSAAKPAAAASAAAAPAKKKKAAAAAAAEEVDELEEGVAGVQIDLKDVKHDESEYVPLSASLSPPPPAFVGSCAVFYACSEVSNMQLIVNDLKVLGEANEAVVGIVGRLEAEIKSLENTIEGLEKTAGEVCVPLLPPLFLCACFPLLCCCFEIY